jgi:hypothetical protein
LFDEFLAGISGLFDCLVLDEDVAQAFHSGLHLFEVDFHGARDDYFHDITMTLGHFRHVLHDLVVFLIDSQFLDCHHVLQYYHAAGRIDKPFFNLGWYCETAQCEDLPQDGINVAVGAEL